LLLGRMPFWGTSMTAPKDKFKTLAKKMLLAAEEFRRAAITLEGDQIAGAQLDEHVIIPMTVCWAFAGEIYLKFLIALRTRKDAPITHDLEKLFNNHLPEDIRHLIKAKWENPPAIEAVIRARRKPAITFEDALAESANSFVQFRYHYDGKSMTGFSGDIVGAFRRVIFDLYPTEFSDVRLPLPKGALNTSMQNAVCVVIRKPPKE
jgi:hypothetical protein